MLPFLGQGFPKLTSVKPWIVLGYAGAELG